MKIEVFIHDSNQAKLNCFESLLKEILCEIKKSKEDLMSEISDFSDAAITNLNALQTSLTNIAQDIVDIKNASTGISDADKTALASVATKLTTLAQAAADLDNQNPGTPVIPPTEPTV